MSRTNYTSARINNIVIIFFSYVGHTKNMNIAVCDDEPTVANVTLQNVKNLIEKHNDRNILFNYYVFSDPAELIKKHSEITFDVVFLDIDMPKIGGFDVAEKLYLHYRDIFIIYFIPPLCNTEYL